MPGKNVAVVSEDLSLVNGLKNGLLRGKIETQRLRDNPGLIRAIKATGARLVVLDAADSISKNCDLCRRIRREAAIPIILLMNGQGNDRVRALESGASLCMTKPVNQAELIASICATLRWADKLTVNKPFAKKPLTVNDFVIDPENREVRLGNKFLSLTGREFELLFLLAQNFGHTINRRELLERVWAESQLESDRTVDVHICRLRKKLDRVSGATTARVVSVRGFGYRMQNP